MQKTKALLYSRKQQNSSSPDSKRSNRVKPTSSPIDEIQKFLAINQHQVRAKAQINPNKVVPSNQKSQNKFLERQERNNSKIYQLEEQVEYYKGLLKDLANKNKKLEQQMILLLQQLESRCNNDNLGFVARTTQPSPKNQQRLKTLQTSADQNSPSNAHLTPPRYQQGSFNKDQQIDYLYEYIQNLQNTMKQVLAQTQQLESDIKKGVKKDLVEMEQRLMNYIFGLEERVSETTFRNHDLLKKIQSARGRDQQELDMTKKSGGRSDPRDSSNYFQLSMTDGKSMGVSGKKDSIVSMINIEVSDQSQKILPVSAQKLIKNQHSLPQTPKIVSKICQKCAQHIKTIEQLTQKNKKIQQELNKYHKLLSETKKQLMTIQNQKYPHNSQTQYKSPQNQYKIVTPHKQQHESKLAQIRQQESGQQSELDSQNIKLQQKINLLQSNINILIDSSGQSSFTQEKHQQPIQESIRKSQSSENVESFLKLDKVKDQLVNVMQELQEIIHECQAHPKNELVNQLNRKFREQVEYIHELEEEVSRLRMEIEESKTSREKLEKFIKVKVKEQQAQSPYFRPLSDPISCIDHRATKGKLDHIITQIKKFQIELDQNIQKSNKPKARTL